jgi:hypothetical protein
MSFPQPAADANTTIASIKALIATASDDDLGTARGSGTVFLGAAGREFRADRSDVDNFAAEANDEYISGEGANVNYAAQNDPRETRLTFDHLTANDVYIRYLPTADSSEAWRVERVDVTVTGADGQTVTYGVLAGAYKRWFGNQVGLKLVLNRR